MKGSLTSIALLLILLLPAPAGIARASDGYGARVSLLPDREFAPALLAGIREARRSIVCGYFLFKVTASRGNEPLRIAAELVAARKRGVEVTVILERDKGGRDRLNDENGRTAALLSRGGVRVRFDSPRTTTHVKAVVIDSRLVYLGSHNLTQSALRHNNELSLLVDSPDLAAEILQYLNRL